MVFETFEFNPFHENTYVIYDETGECVILDPGNFTPDENNILDDFFLKNRLTPVGIINTHNHLDHVFGVSYLVDKYNIEITCHEQELIWIDMFEDTCKRYGLKTTNTPPTPTNLINEGEVFRFGNTELKAIHVPGHSAGSLVFHNTKDNVIFCGDVIFQNSIGRTDLPGGNYNQLLTNIKTKLLTLPKETLILPGHGDNTTIGTEKSENPFLI